MNFKAIWSKLLSVACVVAWLAGPQRVEAAGPDDNPFGLGIILGEPTGLTAKFWLGDDDALDSHLTWDFTDEGFAFFVDYLHHFTTIDEESHSVDLPVYVGIGGKLFVDHDSSDQHDDDLGLGLRIPIGISAILTEAPIEFFGEVAPGLRLIPGTDFDIDGGIGFRYYF